MKDLFNKLDIFINKNTIKEKPPEEDKECCDNPDIVDDKVSLTCINCGRINPYYVEQVERQIHLNPKYQLKTYIKYSSKYRNLCRLNSWDMDYKENTANNSYKEIKEICDKYKLNQKVYDKSCFIYKYIYIDKNITSRNRIKRSLYIVCIKKSCSYFNIKISIKEMLKNEGLTFKNYQKAYSKIKHLKELNF